MKGSECSLMYNVWKKCQGETPSSVMAAEGLVVDGEKYNIVDRFYYLGDARMDWQMQQ